MTIGKNRTENGNKIKKAQTFREKKARTVPVIGIILI